MTQKCDFYQLLFAGMNICELDSDFRTKNVGIGRKMRSALMKWSIVASLKCQWPHIPQYSRVCQHFLWHAIGAGVGQCLTQGLGVEHSTCRS